MFLEKMEVMVQMQNIIWILIMGALGMWISLSIKNQHSELSVFKEIARPDSTAWQWHKCSPRYTILDFDLFDPLFYTTLI